jgi:hypothetical protein
MMTVRYLPNVGNKGLFFTTAGRGVLYLLDSLSGDVSEVYDAKVGDGHCVLTQPFANTTRILISMYTSNQVRQRIGREWAGRDDVLHLVHHSS